jgi:hypothetical protein
VSFLSFPFTAECLAPVHIYTAAGMRLFRLSCRRLFCGFRRRIRSAPEVLEEDIIIEKNPVLNRLMPALHLTLRLRVTRRSPVMLDILIIQPFGQIG